MADQDGVARKIFDPDEQAIRVAIVSGGTGGGGGGTTIAVKEGGSTVSGTVDTVDFGNGLDVNESPAGEANITVDLGEYAGADLPISAGGTGASDAATARANLGITSSGTPYYFDVAEQTGVDDDAKFAAALAAASSAGGGVIVFSPGSYTLADDYDWTVNTDGPLTIRAESALITYTGSGTMFTARRTAGFGTQIPFHVVGGRWFGSPTAECGFRMVDNSGGQFWRVFMHDWDVGKCIELFNETSWTEQTLIIGCRFGSSQHAFYTRKDPATGANSFARTQMQNCVVSGGTAGEALIVLNANPYDSEFSGIFGNIAPDADLFYLNGGLNGTTIRGVGIEAGGSSSRVFVVGPDVGTLPTIYDIRYGALAGMHLTDDAEIADSFVTYGDTLSVGYPTAQSGTIRFKGNVRVRNPDDSEDLEVVRAGADNTSLVFGGFTPVNKITLAPDLTETEGDIYIGAGGLATASVGLELDSSTKAFLPSRMTTTQRDALIPHDGMMIYNNTAEQMQFYENGAWTAAGGGSLDADLVAIAALTRTRGDLLVGGASAWQDLAVGAAGTVLTSDGTDPSWQTPAGGALDADLVAIAALTRTRGDLIVGGASDWTDLAISATSGALLRGNGTDPAWVTDVALANGTYTSGSITGGNVTNATSFRSDRTYTTTAEPADLSVGTPFSATQNITINHAGGGSGPNTSTSFYGPRAVFNSEGRFVYNVSTTPFTFSTPGFGDFAITKNQPSSTKTLTPAWSYIAGRTYLADGATVTMSQTDASPGGAAFFDAVIFATANTGTFSGSSHVYSSYISSPFVVGNTTLGGRIAYEVRDINDYYVAPGLSGAEALADGLLTEPVDTTATPTITVQYGVHIPALTGATTNYGVYSLTQNVLAGIYGGVSSGGDLTISPTTHATKGTLFLDAPTTEVVVTNYTNTAATYKTLVNDATITMNATSGSFHGIEWSPQVAFQQDGNVIGGAVTFRDDTIYRNVGGVSGVDIGPVYSFWASPTLRTQNGTSTVSNFYGFTSGLTTDQVTAGTMTITNSTNFVAAGPTVGANTTIGTHRGIHITESTVTGTLVSQVGVDIGDLSAGTTLNAGIRNASLSILKVGVYGDDASGGDLTLSSTTHSTKGDIVLSNPTAILATDNYGSQSSGGHLTLHSTTHATAGDIQLHNPTTELVVANYTNTAATYTPLRLDATITMDASGGSGGTGNSFQGFTWAPTVVYEQAGNIFGGGLAFKDGTTYKNATTENNAPGILASFVASPTIQSDDVTLTTSIYTGFSSAPVLAKTASGSSNVTTMNQFSAGAPTLNIGTSVATRTGVTVANAGSALVGTQIGIDVANMTAATTANIGIRNAGTLRQTNSATFGADAAATWRIHLQGGNAATAAIGLDTSTTGPTTHGTNSGGGTMSIYKGATNWYFLIAFNDAGTQRYRYMQLNGTAATWTHGTTLPT